MLSKRGVFIAAAVVVLAPLISAAQTESEFQGGERQFTLIGSGLSDDGLDNTGFPSSTNTGRFLNLQRVIRQDVSLIDVADGSGLNDSTGLIAEYYFGFGAWVPLVGLSMGYVQDDNENDQFAAGPEIGLKYFMNPTTFLYGLFGYRFVDNTGDFYDTDRFVYGLGLGLSFSY